MIISLTSRGDDDGGGKITKLMNKIILKSQGMNAKKHLV